MRLKTKLIHAGVSGDPHTGAVVPPIYQVSTFEQDGVGKNRGYAYSRANNPTREAVEKSMPKSKAAQEGSPLPPVWPLCRPFCCCSIKGIISSAATTYTAGRTA